MNKNVLSAVIYGRKMIAEAAKGTADYGKFYVGKITVLYNSLIFNCSEMSFWRGVMI